MSRHCRIPICLCLAFGPLLPALAQTQTATPAAPAAAAAAQVENVRLDYAQVLDVEPVYETLRARRSEVVCEDAEKPHQQASEKRQEGRLARVWDSVKGIFSGGGEEEQVQEDAPATALQPSQPACRSVPQEREFRRPIAYDVDYMYKGMKYRSRLPEDPGNRLRIRISVMPYVAGQPGDEQQ